MDIGSLIVTLGVNAYDLAVAQSKYTAFAKGVDMKTKQMEKSLNRLSISMKSVGRNMSLYLTAPLTILGGVALNAFKNYEFELAKIRGLTDTSAEVTNRWGEEMKILSGNVGITTNKLAESMYFIASSGIDSSKAIDILTASSKAAASGLGDVKQISDVVTSAMNAYKKEGLDAAKITDILTAAVREGKIEPTEMAGAISYVIPIASELGVQFHEIAAGMAAMSDYGTAASTTATNLRQALSDFLNPAKESEDTMRSMGFNAKMLREILDKHGLLATFQFLNETVKKHGYELAKLFPEVRGLTGVLTLVGQNLEKNKEIFSETANAAGDTQRAFEEVTNTLQFRYNQALVQVNNSMLELGDSVKERVINVLNGFTNVLKNVTENWKALSEGQQRFRINTLLVIAATGPLLVALATMISVYTKLMKTLYYAKKGMELFKIACATNPILALILVASSLAAIYLKVRSNTIKAAEAQERLNTANERASMLEPYIDYNKIMDQVTKLGKLSTDQKALLLQKVEQNIETLNSRVLDGAEKIDKEIKRSYSNINVETGKSIFSTEEIANFKKYVDEANASQLKDTKTLNQLLDEQKVIRDRIKKSMETGSKITIDGFEYTEDQAEIIKKYQDELTFLNTKLQKTGDTISYADDATKLYNSTFDTFLRSGISDASPIMKEVVKGMDDMKSEMITSLLIMDDYDKIMTSINIQEKLFGKNLDELRLDATNQALENFANAGIQSSAAIEMLQQQIETLNASISNAALDEELKWIALQENLLGKEFDSTSALIQVQMGLIQELSKDYEKNAVVIAEATAKLKLLGEQQLEEQQKAKNQQIIHQQVADSMTQMFTLIGEGMVDAEKASIAMVDTMINGIQQIIQALLMQAIIGMLANGSTKGIPGLVIATIGIAALKAIWEKQKSATENTAKLAKGGVIPAGYNNDTYPAMLSSGETVLPAKSLDSIINQSSSIYIDGNWELRGDVLYFAMKRASKKMGSRGMKVTNI